MLPFPGALPGFSSEHSGRRSKAELNPYIIIINGPHAAGDAGFLKEPDIRFASAPPNLATIQYTPPQLRNGSTTMQ